VELRRRLAEIADLRAAAMVLAWDERTMMPPAGASARAEQLATLARLRHSLLTADDLGRLLEELAPWAEGLDPDSDEAALLRVTRRDYEKARRVPAELRGEMARAAALALPVWQEARRRSDWGLFQPHLERAIELRRRYVECFPAPAEPYDILLDDFEPGTTTAEVRALCERLKQALVPFLAEIAAREGAVDDRFLAGPFPIEAQRRVELTILHALGFDRRSWRLDETEHPFASQSGPDDIRLATRHEEESLGSLFACLHELGHGLYEHGIDRSLARTPLGQGASLGLHESQSRLWENLVGRSRPFWRRFFPLLQEAFPEQLAGVDAERFYRAVNAVRPSLIRVQADEATYGLHIVLRFELEQDLLSGRLAAADVPEAWSAKVGAYLGLEVPDAARGPLQDTHWAAGSFGYFPTYLLGTVAAAQIWERLRQDLPDLDLAIEAGDFQPLREWLRTQVHRHGRKYLPGELLARVTGSRLDPDPFLRYLRHKLGEIYGLPA
jgi:carboxypeptidase Taq